MAFRDEGEALRAKNEALESTLADKRRDLAELEQRLDAQLSKDVQDEAELAQLRTEVAELRHRLGEGPPPPELDKTKAARVVTVAGVVSVASLITAVYLLQPSPPPPVPPPPVPTSLLAPRPPSPSLALTPTRAGLAPGPLTFLAQVSATEGDAPGVTVGDGCAVLATLAEAESLAPDFVIRCGERTLYDGGVGSSASRRWTLTPAPRAPAGSAAELRVHDAGRTAPRPQLSIETHLHRASVWSESDPRFAVHLAVEAASLRREHGARTSRLPLHAWVVRDEATDAGSPLPDAARCELDVVPVECRSFNARATLRCGADLVYGERTSGWVQAEWAGARLTRFVDEGSTAENGDPRFLLDVREGTLVVGEESWSARFRLDTSSKLDGARFVGLAIAADGTRQEIALEGTTLRVESDTLEAEIEEDPQSGEVRVRAGARRLALRFGPGFATLGGSDQVGASTVVLFRTLL